MKHRLRPWRHRDIAAALGLVTLSFVLLVSGTALALWTPTVLLLASAYLIVRRQAVYATRASRRLEKIDIRLRKLAEDLEANHKKASTWNYHLRLGLGLSLSAQDVTPTSPLLELPDPETQIPAAEERREIDWDGPWRPANGRISAILLEPAPEHELEHAVSMVRSSAHTAGLDVEIIAPGASGRARLPDGLVRVPVEAFGSAAVLNACLSAATGEFALILARRVSLREGALEHLLEAIRRENAFAVQPVILDNHDSIVCAGYGFVGDHVLPVPLLTGHPAEDALRIDRSPVSGVSSRAMLVRVDAVRQLHGFREDLVDDLSAVDICLRAAALHMSRTVLCGRALATYSDSGDFESGTRDLPSRRRFLKTWPEVSPVPDLNVLKRSGFAVAHLSTDRLRVPSPVPLLVRDRSLGRRWGIRVASEPGPRGDAWGDTYFAQSLADALTTLGDTPVVHRHRPQAADAEAFDDVSLVLRGKFRVNPWPGRTNILWVLSHPESVTVDEINEFDLVFAASFTWARRMTELSGRPVLPLLQATDPRRFNTSVHGIPESSPIFVAGTHAGRQRGAIGAAITSGTPLAVYGRGWENQLPKEWLRGEHIPNDKLVGYYRGAPRVIGDHWKEMAEHGFIQNRLFDAVAAGCKTISDPVDGIEDTFYGAVQTYRSPSEFAFLCSSQGEEAFPSLAELEAISRDVRQRHSFQARALELVSALDDARS